jgi:hypothetical protein
MVCLGVQKRGPLYALLGTTAGRGGGAESQSRPCGAGRRRHPIQNFLAHGPTTLDSATKQAEASRPEGGSLLSWILDAPNAPRIVRPRQR